MKNNQEADLFTKVDFEILKHAVSIYPNLEFACYATKLAMQNLKFPINNYQELLPLFQIKDLPRKIAARRINKASMRKFFPKQYFPIEDAQDFLGKTLAALSWGDVIHYHERFIKEPERFVPSVFLRERQDASTV